MGYNNNRAAHLGVHLGMGAGAERTHCALRDGATKIVA